MVVFVNYDYIKKAITEKIKSLDSSKEHWFYSSDYSDILGMDLYSDFCNEFISFFEQFKNIKMEIRTKSSNIKPILDL
ncbi:MAG: hypothetical protein P1U46_00810 [Patescibacteria group bacterium]|nr:hypothetical protein [Patescibacteria group bacterium]